MRTANTLIRLLGGCPGWSESSLGAHSFCWFCHVAAHLRSILFHNCFSSVHWCLYFITEPHVFGVCDQVRLKPACSASETRKRLKIYDIGTRSIILSRQRTTRALIRLRVCGGWSVPLLFAYDKSRFSHDVVQLLLPHFTCHSENTIVCWCWDWRKLGVWNFFFKFWQRNL